MVEPASEPGDRPRTGRRTPLVAPGRDPVAAEAPARGSQADPPPRSSAPRSVALGVGIGVGTAVGVAALVYAIAAIPLYLLAQISPDGLDRPGFRTAFLVSLGIGGVLGLVVGAATGVWAARGGRLPTDRTSFSDR